MRYHGRTSACPVRAAMQWRAALSPVREERAVPSRLSVATRFLSAGDPVDVTLWVAATSPPPPDPDMTVPSVARGYDYLLGRKDNFAVDRQAVQMLLQVALRRRPRPRPTARSERGPCGTSRSNALRSVHPGLATILADIRRSQDILNHLDLLQQIDFNQPASVVIFSVLDVIDDSYDPVGIVAQFRA